MRAIRQVILAVIFLNFAVVEVFAHDTGVMHEEPVPTISPMLLIWIVLGVGIVGFLLWKFVLHAPKSSSTTQSVLPEKTPPPVQEKTVSQNDKSEVAS